MDKYDGINKAEVTSTPIYYEVRRIKNGVQGQAAKTSDDQNPKNAKASKPAQRTKKGSRQLGIDSWTIIRFAVCFILAAVCLVGKLTSIDYAQKASGFIKTELSRDSAKELSELFFEQDQESVD